MVNALRVALMIAQMKRNMGKSPPELQAIRDQNLKDLFARASKSPQYKKILKNHDGDLSSLPVTGKEAIRDSPEAFLSPSLSRQGLEKISTSGSTGIPVTVYFDKHDCDYRIALEYHQLTELGIGPFQTQTHLTYANIPPKLIQRLGFFRHHYLSIYDKEEKNLEALRRIRTDSLAGFPSALSLLAQKNSSSSDPLSVGKLLSYGEVLAPGMRRFLSDSFRAKVHNLYGAMEVGWIAWEDESGVMRIHADSVIVEAVDEAGVPVKQGTEGNAVVTPLWPRAMPLIRYNVGDRIVLGPNNTIKSIEGRDDDFIRLPDGSRVSPRILPCALVDVPGIKEYQIIQEGLDDFIFKYVPAKDPDLKKIAAIFRKHLGSGIKLGFEKTDALPMGGFGKRKKVISHLG